MSKNFNSSMPNYISSFPLTKNKKLVDTEHVNYNGIKA